MTLLVDAYSDSYWAMFADMTISLGPVLLSRFILHLRRCTAGWRAQVSKPPHLSTVVFGSTVTQALSFDEFGSDLTLPSGERVNESPDE